MASVNELIKALLTYIEADAAMRVICGGTVTTVREWPEYETEVAISATKPVHLVYARDTVDQDEAEGGNTRVVIPDTSYTILIVGLSSEAVENAEDRIMDIVQATTHISTANLTTSGCDWGGSIGTDPVRNLEYTARLCTVRFRGIARKSALAPISIT